MFMSVFSIFKYMDEIVNEKLQAQQNILVILPFSVRKSSLSIFDLLIL